MTDPSVIYGLELKPMAGIPVRNGSETRHALQHIRACRFTARPDCQSGAKFTPGSDGSCTLGLSLLRGRRANPQGKSLFATTLEEHNRNVSGYRHAMKKAGGR